MTSFDRRRRSDAAELMDADDVDYDTFRGCLSDLATVNRLSLGYRPTLEFLHRLARDGRWPKDRALRVIDVGCGYGDTLRAIAHWAAKRGLAIDLTGVDRNRWSARAAAEATPQGMNIAWRTADIFDYRPDDSVDVIVSSLFAHHLDDAALLRFLVWMEGAAALGWFINDLHRHQLAFSGFKAASRALRLHPFVQHDGPVSFARSFVAADWRRMLAEAGIRPDAARISRRFPFRLCVDRTKPA